jgi:hypothetical protein
MPGGGAGPMMMRGGTAGPVTRSGLMATVPVNGGRVQGWSGRTAWGHDHFMIISTTGSTTAISSRSALVVTTTAMIPAGPTMAGNGSTLAVATATTESKSCV